MITEKMEKSKLISELNFGPLLENELEELSDLVNITREAYSGGQEDIRLHSSDYYNWMYYQNPAGNAIVFRAKHNGKIVSSFAVAPKKMHISGRTLICGKTMDMFTHPEYQGLGLMGRLAKMVFEEVRNRSIEMWYVTPSQNSYPIFLKKWGYKETFHVIFLMSILRWSNVLGEVLGKRAIGNIVGSPIDIFIKLTNTGEKTKCEMHEEDTFGPETDELWENSWHNRVCLVKDSEYMNWRYKHNPEEYVVLKYYQLNQIKGLLVLKKVKKKSLEVGEVVDYLFRDNNLGFLNYMFWEGNKYLREIGCSVAEGWAIEGSEGEKILRKAGFWKRRSRVSFLLSPGAPENDFYDQRGWILTQGDGNDI